MIVPVLLSLSLASMAAAGPVTSAQANFQRIVERLDMTSFPNSLRQRVMDKERKLRDFAAMTFRWEGNALLAEEVDGSWLWSFRPLPGLKGRTRLCLYDHAQTAGSYTAQAALDLKLGVDGLYKAQEIKARGCRSFAE